jgi:hypothetical protein
MCHVAAKGSTSDPDRNTVSSTGVIPKTLSQNLTRLNLHPNTYTQQQKSVILGTCSIARNFLNYK